MVRPGSREILPGQADDEYDPGEEADRHDQRGIFRGKETAQNECAEPDKQAEYRAGDDLRHFVSQPRALDLFRATAARTRAFNAASSILSPSWKSMARLVFPSRLELNRREGSFTAAPWAKV